MRIKRKHKLSHKQELFLIRMNNENVWEQIEESVTKQVKEYMKNTLEEFRQHLLNNYPI